MAARGRAKTRIALLFACLLPVCMHAWAQRFNFAEFGQPDGLLNQDVSAIVQDRTGILWVGTENGVFQMDGSRFSQVSGYRDAPDGSVLAMHVDAGGTVWVLGAKRLVYFREDGLPHTVPNFDVDMMLRDGGALTSLPELPNTVFVLRHGQLLEVHGDFGDVGWKVRPVLSPGASPGTGPLHGLVADPARASLWTVCGDGLCEVHPGSDADGDGTGSVSQWNPESGVPRDGWASLLLDRQGKVWAQSPSQVVRLDPATLQVDRMGDPLGGAADASQFPQMVEDRAGNVVVNLKDGVARLHDGQWQHLSASNGLPPTELISMFFDRGGGFWVAPIGGGLARWLGYGNWQAWTRAQGLSSDVVWNMVRSRAGPIWVSTDGGLDRVDAATGAVAVGSTAASLGDSETIAEDSRGHIWVAGSGGRLTDYDPASRRSRRVLGDTAPSINRLVEERPGGDPHAPPVRIWICSAAGVSYLSADDGWAGVHASGGAGAPSSQVWAGVQERSGAMLFSTHDGLYREVNGGWARIALPKQILGVDYPVLAAAPDDTVWMQAAVPTPLVHLRIAGSQAVLLGSVSNTVIGSDDVSFITVDRRGWLWVGTDRGVYVRNGERWVHCTEEDGLISDDTDTGGVLADSDGSMWFGTARGLSHLLHPASLFATGAPPLSIRDVRLGRAELQTDEDQSFNLRAPALTAHIYSADYTRSRSIVFRYRLDGLENSWRTTEDGTLRFSGLPPGDYKLSLQAVDRRAHTFSPPVSYAFTILPPWYRRDRTKALAGLLLLAILVAAWQLNLRHLRTSEASLKQKVDRQTAQLLEEKAELERAQEQLVQLARRDSLTGLLNRSAIFEVLALMRQKALLDSEPLAVVMADLDHFKTINDEHGHAIGDAVLRECAERFRETLRPGDAIGRYGGEELLILIPGLQPSHAAVRMESIRAAIASQTVLHGDRRVAVTCSFGVAWLSGQHSTLEAVLNAADAALYVAKQNGRNCVEFTPGSLDEVYAVVRR